MSEIIHASCVVFNGNGCLIVGASGQGKSSLALQLMAYGATLVSDDQVALSVQNGDLVGSTAPNIAGLIEARRVGILNADHVRTAFIRWVVDLDIQERDRIPSRRTCVMLGVTVPLLHTVNGSHFPAAILQILRVGRHTP